MKLFIPLVLAVARFVTAAPANQLQARDSREHSAVPGIRDQEFINTVMRAHWYWRRIHCAQDLKWDTDLAKQAYKSVSACTRKVQHDRAGSNLSGVGPSPENRDVWIEFARTAIHGWHEEETKYPYGSPEYSSAFGHFTQLVWRDSSKLGCALSKCDDFTDQFPGRIYCFYDNPGNNVARGQFEANVWPPVCADPSKEELEEHFGGH